MTTQHKLSKSDTQKLRRTALAQQGLTAAKPFGSGYTGAQKAIEHIGYIQVDTISVVERAHHHVFASRVPNFKPEYTNRLLTSGKIFEYWAHAAAFLPMCDFRFSLPRKAQIKAGKIHWQKHPDRKLMKSMLDRITIDGPLRSRDVEEISGKAAGWWDWKPAKRALEQLYMEGDLMVCDRQGFQKTYDLAERVIPDATDTTLPSVQDTAEHLIEQQFRCHGFMTLKAITYQRRDPALRKMVKTILEDKVADGDVMQLKVNSEVYFVPVGLLDEPKPRVLDRLLILSPFDNAVILRDRLTSLFDFDYQIECYVPEAKRKYGYFCLPLVYKDSFVGRIDCKAHRTKSQLEVRSAHFCDHPFDLSSVSSAFEKAIIEFAKFQNCESIVIHNVHPPAYARVLEKTSPILIDQ